jgi:3-deoxy-D-manno-octulosonate 8-phosphate phosphatase (KDO 8-P phosphatase)
VSKIDFPLHHIQGVVFDLDGVLSPATVAIGVDGIPQRMTNLRDGYAIKLAIKRGLKVAIITGADAPGLAERFAMLGVTDYFSAVESKWQVLQDWLVSNGMDSDDVTYVGDDVPDLQCMQHVGLPIAPADASADAICAARYVTVATGGHGVAREVIEEILRDRRLWPTDDVAYS